MKNLILLFIFLTANLNCLFAQEHEALINLRYKGKEEKLIEFLQQNLKYPSVSLTNKSIGYSIAGISITPLGEINEISIINTIDEAIDKEIIRVLKKTKNKWEIMDTVSENQTFYIQIVYTIDGSGNSLEIKNPVNKKYNFIEPVVITAMVFDSNLIPETNESIATKCSEFMKSNNYEDALNQINELIKRNPFNKDLYQLRMRINQKLKRNEFIIIDTQKMNNFIPGISLDNLLL